jgi:serine/threonine protein phosphatase PrpC
MAVLADGMGGRSGGRKASDQVMMTAKQLFERYAPNSDDPVVALRQLVLEAHTVIKLTAISSEEEPHSTIATFLINPDGSCHWVHAGDSRIYHFHDKQLVKRTLDHSYVQTLVNQGEITPAQANFHPQSNILMGCLGTDKDPPLDNHFISKLEPGDTLMACSDGVWHYFTDMELGSVLSTLSARDASEFLIEKARARAKGGGDNLSVAIVKVDPLTA